MEYLPYERIAQLVTISALNKDNSAMKSFMSQLCVSKRQICIKFSDYVKSQVHLNISYSLYGRHISQFVKASYYLDGDARYYDDAAIVLKYFYHDMSNFLINNVNCVDLEVVVDTDIGEEVADIDIDQIQSDFMEVLDSVGTNRLPEMLKKFEYVNIFDVVEDVDDARDKARSYVMAAVLKRYSEMDKVYKVRLLKCKSE